MTRSAKKHKKCNETNVPEIHRRQGESNEDFGARVRVFGEALEAYGLKLADSDEYKKASDEQKRKMLDLLPRRISSALMKQGEAWQLEPRILLDDVKDAAERRRELEQERRGY